LLLLTFRAFLDGQNFFRQYLDLFKTDRQYASCIFAAAVFSQNRGKRGTVKDTQADKTEELVEPSKEEALTVLRTETALSRFPLHRIAKKSGDIAIEIDNKAAAVYWSVSHNTKYGQPGPLAYRIDTLLVNRRIEEAGKPVPRLIRLGSLPEIARELGFAGHNWNLLRRAIHQNASAYITAKISYRAADRSERFLEAGFNRYNVVFTGEKLPSGEVASAVYLVLSDIFLDVLNTAQWRPLDYEYMKTLPPGSQRFYEIVSYQVYAALHYGNPRAKFTYSEYCLLSTATRYLDFDHVKKQMYKILRPHIQSGYLARVEYEAIVNEQNEPDWIMYLTPGVNASREYHAFTGVGAVQKPAKSKKARGARGAEDKPDTLMLPFAAAEESFEEEVSRATPSGEEDGKADDDASTRELIALLIAADLNRSDAERFAREQPMVCRRQLEYLPFVKEFKSSRGAYLRRAIEGDFGAPAAYTRQQARQEAQAAFTSQRGREQDEKRYEKARQSHQKRLYRAYEQYLKETVGQASEAQPEATTTFLDQEIAQRSTYTSGPLAGRPLTLKALEAFDQEESRLERARLFWCKQGVTVLSFWEWDRALNPKPFDSSEPQTYLSEDGSN